MLHQALPRCKARCLETGITQPERDSLSARDAAAVRTDGCVQLAVAQQQLKWKLAETAKQSITSQWLSVAIMSDQVRPHQCLGSLVGKGEVMLRSSDEGFESGSMGEMQMFIACWWLASRIAPTNAEQNEELQPSDSNTIRSVNRYDPEVLPEGSHLCLSLRL